MFGGVSQNMFGVKTSSVSATSLSGATEAAISTLAGFATMSGLLPTEISALIDLAYNKFLVPFDNRAFNRIGTTNERDSIVTGLNNYYATITNDNTLKIFIDSISRATNAAYNMKTLESSFLNYKRETQAEIDNLKRQIAVLMDVEYSSIDAAGGRGSASFAIELTAFYKLYIHLYGYHPDDDTWIRDTRTTIVRELLTRMNAGEITEDDILPELYLNT
tara:strand:- start:320 stop:976 length:657 start_codon:yes stop_codon:yes gene_type:complete